MGGNVFDTTARRLTTKQLLQLLAHTKAVLGPFFTELEITRFFGEKETHGDLDVLCGIWTGGEGWKGANELGNSVPGSPTLSNMPEVVTKYEQAGKDEEHDWTRKEVKEFCALLAEKLGAVKWAKNGYEASFAVPCSVIDKCTDMTGEEDFYQIDLVLVQPPRLGFSVVTQSYGVTALLFAAAVRRLSSSFTCHNDRFVIRYSPYRGLKAIEVELTHDPKEFMDWAGLDSERFDQGFETETDYFMWLTCLVDNDQGTNSEERKAKYESLLEKRFPQGWRRMAEAKRSADPTKMPKGHGKIRLDVLNKFRDWLATTIYGPEDAVKVDKVKGEVDTATDPAQAITTEMSNLSIDKTSPPPAPAPVLSAREQNLLNPDTFLPLSFTANAALDYFGKVPEHQALFDARKQEATVMAEKQKRNTKENADSQRAKDEAAAAKAKEVPLPPPTPVVATDEKERVSRPEEIDEGVSL